MKRSLIILALITACDDGEPPASYRAPATARAPVPVADFGPNPGALRMYLHVPDGAPASPDIVVAMHGCSQQAADFFNAGWQELADLWKFVVIYPEQTSANNPINCFNWAGEHGDETNLVRGRGENQSIKSMIDHARSRLGGGGRVFLVGFSAGGAQVAVMLATWPEVFTAAAINAGLPYRCATTVNGAFACMNQGRSLSSAAWGDLVRAAHPGYPGPYPRLSIWHGTQDSLVKFSNMAELVKQWTNVMGIDQTADATGLVDGMPYAAHQRDGVTVVETYTLTGKDHITAIDPGFAPAGGCGRAVPFIVDANICAAYHQARFFGLEPAGGPAPDAGIPVADAAIADAGGAPIESATGTCTEHYVAGRLGPTSSPAAYLACGQRHGYVERFVMYRFGTCWSESADGAGCP